MCPTKTISMQQAHASVQAMSQPRLHSMINEMQYVSVNASAAGNGKEANKYHQLVRGEVCEQGNAAHKPACQTEAASNKGHTFTAGRLQITISADGTQGPGAAHGYARSTL